MDDIYVNVDSVKSVDPGPSTRQTGARAPLILGLLSVSLLVGLIGLGACFADLSRVTANLTERLAEETEQLKADLSEVTQERIRLRSVITQGWTMFNISLYFLSNEFGSWTKGRDDCVKRDSHLVVIDSDKEQSFLSGFTKQAAWIGLDDRNKEGSWRWIDGAPLTVSYWWRNQPDNGGRGSVNEDCAHIAAETAEWNDLPCETSLQWICEQRL